MLFRSAAAPFLNDRDYLRRARAALQRGITRGELAPDADLDLAVDLLVGPVYYRLLARGTAGLVASVVQVGDVEAVDLMRGLHERLRDGETMAVGLHAARAALDPTDSRQFVNWCAFTAYGAG